MAGKFNINKNTPWMDYGYEDKGQFTLDHKFKGKPVSSKSDGLPEFSLQGGWSGDGKNTWSNTSVSFDMMGADNRTNNNTKFKKSSLKHVNITGSSDKKGIMLSVDGVQRWMNKDTLAKGTNTMLGMAAQVGPGGSGEISYLDNGEIDWLDPANSNVVQGTNYANPAYARSVAQEAADKKRQEDKHTLFELTGGLLGEEKDDSKGKGNTSSEASKGSGGGESTTNLSDLVSGKGRSYGVVKKSKSTQRRERMAGEQRQWQQSALRKQADSIQAKLGRGSIGIGWHRVGYGNRMEPSNWAKTSKNVITDYYKKSGLIGWAQGINPEHAQVNPDLTMDVVASSKYKTIQTPVKQKSGMSYRYHVQATHTYKTVNRKDNMTKGDTMDWIYDKVMKKAKSNKKLYSTYYTPDSEVEEYQYYSVSDDDFKSYQDYKTNLISTIDSRRANQQFVIDSIDSDTKTLDEKDKSASLIPSLEKSYMALDDKASVLKDEVGEYDWQKKISQEQFGTDTIQGDSHISHVLDSYGGQVRGGAYYSQDVGQLVKKSKSYEDSLALQIEQKQDAIDAIEVDAKEDLTEYYTDVTDKEYEIANKEYLSKSLALTKEERAELEYQRRAQGMGGGQPAMQYKPKTSRGRPSLRQKSQSSSQYKNKRTRGGRDNIGGIIV
jgi:hypothetical protein